MITAVSDVPTLTRVHHDLLVPSFPREERGTLEELVAGTRDGSLHVWVAHSPGPSVPPSGGTPGPPAADDDLAGVAVVCTWPQAPHAALLGWLAVGGRERSRGVGAALLGHVLRQFEDSMMLAEIEPADGPIGDPVHGDPRARVRFYHRHGARRLALPYWQPATGPGTGPVQLDLVVLPAPGQRPPDRVPAGPVRELLEAYALAELPDPLAGPLEAASRGPHISTEPLMS